MTDRCVCCGNIIPEGRIVCKYCESISQDIKNKFSSNEEVSKIFRRMRDSINNDFKEEWSKKKFKWFFKKHRQRKLRLKIVARYRTPVFDLLEQTMDEMLPKMYGDTFFEQFTDIRDVDIGDKVVYNLEELK